MSPPEVPHPPVEVTGVRRTPAGVLELVEVEARGQPGRLQIAQAVTGALAGRLHGVRWDGRLRAVVLDGAEPLAVVLSTPEVGPGDFTLPVVQMPEGWQQLDESEVRGALAPLVAELGEGLYSVTAEQRGPAEVPPPDLVSRSDAPDVLDPGPWAPAGGTPVLADLGRGWRLLLTGRAALARGERALVLSRTFLVEADGFQARRHDRGAREAFARSWRGVLDEAEVRAALWDHLGSHPRADLGPLHPRALEPAAAEAEAVFASLTAEEGVAPIGPLRRETTPEGVAFVVVVGSGGSVALVSLDGQELTEGRVLGPSGWEGGLRPSPRALARALRRTGGAE